MRKGAELFRVRPYIIFIKKGSGWKWALKIKARILKRSSQMLPVSRVGKSTQGCIPERKPSTSLPKSERVLPAPGHPRHGRGFASGQCHGVDIAFMRLKEDWLQKVEVRSLSFPLGPGHYFRENKASLTNCWGLLACLPKNTWLWSVVTLIGTES